MGITGLLPFLQKSSRSIHISEFRGQTVAVDSYCWLHKGAFGCCEKLALGEDTNIYVMYCLKYIKLLQTYGIKVVMVFDGQHLPAKMETEKKRREQRQQARKRASELMRLGKASEARSFLKQCIDISHEMALALIKECRKMNVDCIVAPHEADAQLAYLNMQKIVDVVITEDSDLVLFGCDKIIFKFDLSGSGNLVESDKLYISMEMRPDEFTFEKFRYMCILSGCDYLASLPGIGLKKAQKFVKMTADPNIYNVLSKLPAYLNMRHLSITDEYKDDFMTAEATFKHQVIFDPSTRKLAPLTDPEKYGTDIRYCKNIGNLNLDNETAFQLALGNLNPFTLKQMDDWSPDKSLPNDARSIWRGNFKTSQSTLKAQPEESPRNSWTVKINKDAIEAEKTSYDARLEEDLKVYFQNDEPEECKPEKDIEKSPVFPEKPFNPFLKKRISLNLSKFRVTKLDSSSQIKSRYFTRSETENCLVDESNKKRKQLSETQDVQGDDCVKVCDKSFTEEFSLEVKKKLTVSRSDDLEEVENLTPKSIEGAESAANKSSTVQTKCTTFSRCRTVGLSKKYKKTAPSKQPTLLNFFSNKNT